MSSKVTPPVSCEACDPVAQDTISDNRTKAEREVDDLKFRLCHDLAKPNSAFVTAVDSDTNSVFKTKSYRHGLGEDLILVTQCGREFKAIDCRPALPAESVTRKRLPDHQSLCTARLLSKITLRDPQKHWYLKNYLGDDSLKSLMDTDDTVLAYLTLEAALHAIRNNTNHNHLMTEIGFAKSYDNVTYSDNNILYPLEFAYAITRMVTCEGHSGASHFASASRILTVLKAVAMDKHEIVTWSMFQEKELELGFKTNSLFISECAPVSTMRQVPSISGDKMGLFIDLVSCALYLENLTPLTFEDREWFNPMNDYWQNIRNSEIFKKGKDGIPYYPGVSMCDDTQTYRGFFGSSQCRVEIKDPKQPLDRHCVYLKYPMPVEVGNVPDGDLTQFAHIPERITPVKGDTIVRKWDGAEYLFDGMTTDGKCMYILRSVSKPPLLLTESEFMATGEINNMIYPHYLALPPNLPITYDDED